MATHAKPIFFTAASKAGDGVNGENYNNSQKEGLVKRKSFQCITSINTRTLEKYNANVSGIQQPTCSRQAVTTRNRLYYAGLDERVQWTVQFEFLATMLCTSAPGIGYIWWFPVLATQNGGGIIYLEKS